MHEPDIGCNSYHTHDKLLVLLRAGLHTLPEEDITNMRFGETDWPQLYRLAVKHGILAIIWDGLQQYVTQRRITTTEEPDRNLKLQWAYNIKQIDRLFREAEVRMVIFKGLPLSSCYPVPQHRECGDIDCWMSGGFADGNRWIENRGIRVNYENPKHATFTYKGVSIENHDTFFDTKTHRIDRILECAMHNFIEKEGYSQDSRTGLQTLSPTAHALFLLRHTSRHLPTGIALRHLTDWALFIKKHGHEINWKALIGILKQCNLMTFWNALNGMIYDSGLVDRSLLPAFQRIPDIEQRLLNHILEPPAFDTDSRILIKRIRNKILRRHNQKWIYCDVLHEVYLLRIWQSFIAHIRKPDSI